MLGTQAFSIYCDWVVRDAAEKNDRIRAENAPLEKVLDALTTVQVWHEGEIKREIDLRSFIEKEAPDDCDGDDVPLIYKIMGDGGADSIEFPWDRIKNLSFVISGVESVILYHPARLPRFNFVEDEGVVEVKLYFGGYSATGLLSNFSGSLEDVQKMIDWNQVTSHIMHIGMVAVAQDGTRSPPNLNAGLIPALDGAMFSLDKIEISKHVIQAALECVNGKDVEPSENVDELLTLAKANPSHKGLCKVSKESMSLESRTAMLQASRDLFQSVEISYPGGSSVHLKLEDGTVLLRSSIDGKPLSFVDFETSPSKQRECTIPVSSIDQLQFKLANMPFSRGYSGHYSPRFTPDGMTAIGFGQNVFGQIVAIFVFDESLDGLELESIPDGGLAQYVSDLTMRLVGVGIGLHTIQHHLDVLGVDVGVEE